MSINLNKIESNLVRARIEMVWCRDTQVLEKARVDELNELIASIEFSITQIHETMPKETLQ